MLLTFATRFLNNIALIPKICLGCGLLIICGYWFLKKLKSCWML